MHNETSPLAKESRGIFLMLISVALFTTTSLLLAYIHQTFKVDGWVATFYRALFGLIVAFSMQSHTGKLDMTRIFTRPLLLARGIVGGLTIPLGYICIMTLGPGRAGILIGSYPIFAAIVAACFIGEPLKRSYFGYITLALIGMCAVLSDSGIGKSQPFFDLLAIGSAAAAGVCVVLIRHLRHTENTSNIFAAQCVFALLLGLFGAGREIIISDPSAFGLVIIASATVIGGQLCITEAFRHINVAKGSTLTMLTPAATALASASLLGELFSPLELIGGAIILFSSYRIVLSK